MRKSPTTFQLSSILKATCQSASGQLLYMPMPTSSNGVDISCYSPLSSGESARGKNEKAEGCTNHRQFFSITILN